MVQFSLNRYPSLKKKQFYYKITRFKEKHLKDCVWMIDWSLIRSYSAMGAATCSPSAASRIPPFCQNLGFLASVTAKMAPSSDPKSRLQTLPDHLGHHRCCIHVFLQCMFQTQSTTLLTILFALLSSLYIWELFKLYQNSIIYIYTWNYWIIYLDANHKLFFFYCPQLL